jgi:hypothetical protein
MSMGLTRRRLYAPVAILAAALIVGAMMIVAGPRATSAQEEESHPAHIHSGTCDTLGEVVYPLTNVGAGSMNAEGTPTAMEQMGSDAATPVEVSVTTVQTDLATLLGADYAINVHESADNIGNYIACGNIGGMVMDGTDLAIGVAELNESGYLGTALLHDNGDGTTTVTVALLEEYGDEGEAEEGTPIASTGSDAAANEVAVDIMISRSVPIRLRLRSARRSPGPTKTRRRTRRPARADPSQPGGSTRAKAVVSPLTPPASFPISASFTRT